TPDGTTNMNRISRFISEIPAELLDGMQEEKEPVFAQMLKNNRSKPNLSSQSVPPRKKAEKITTTGAENATWNVGDKAKHNKWGIGTIVKVTDRKSTRLNSSHVSISYAVFCL